MATKMHAYTLAYNLTCKDWTHAGFATDIDSSLAILNSKSNLERRRIDADDSLPEESKLKARRALDHVFHYTLRRHAMKTKAAAT